MVIKSKLQHYLKFLNTFIYLLNKKKHNYQIKKGHVIESQLSNQKKDINQVTRYVNQKSPHFESKTIYLQSE